MKKRWPDCSGGFADEKEVHRLAKSGRSSAMVARRILLGPSACCDYKVEELEKMVHLGHDNAPSDGLSDASRALLALARGGDKEAREALHRLAKSGRSSAIAAQRALFAERLARAQGYRTLQEWANGAILVSRTQFPVFAKMACTLHGVQGKTVDPSFIAYWRFLPVLMKRQWESNHCD